MRGEDIDHVCLLLGLYFEGLANLNGRSGLWKSTKVLDLSLTLTIRCHTCRLDLQPLLNVRDGSLMRTIELQRWLMLSASLAFALSRSDNDLFDPLNSLKLLLRNGGCNIFTLDRLVHAFLISSCEGA